MMSSAGWSGAGGFRAYLEAARDLAGSRHAGMALYMLESAALRAHFSNLDDSTRGELVALAVELSAGQRGPRFLAALATMDPVGHGAEVIAQVRNRTPVTAESPQDLFALGSAAAAVWSGDLAIPFFYAAIEGFRREGRLGLLAQALNFTAWDEVRRGNTWLAAAAAGEAARLGGDTGQPLYAASSRVVEVIADAGRGQTGAAEPRLAAADGVFLAVGAHPVRALVQLARGLVALACGQYGAAYSRLERMFDPGDVAYHQFMGGWVLADLADAAVHGGADLERVRAILSPWRRIANATSASHLQVQLHYADALLAGDGEAAGRFEEAAAYASADWPYYRARAQLAYGRWLRRRRRAAQARLPLREAVETLDALGAAVLADRARRELRASGESVRRRTAGAWDQLTPQELQIARLAATGLSNREIGERLYLSHRTVGTHLHRLFPKLGVTSRAELRTALEAAGPGTAD
jgi:DNA-binding CsgD family transcriptional regulator